MKYLLSLIILFTFSIKSFGQDVVIVPTHRSEKDAVYNYTMLEKKPLFGNATNKKDSEKALYDYIQKKVEILDIKKNVMAFISFEIHSDGSTQNIVIMRSIGGDEKFDKQAIEIISNLPKWKPASKNGKLVNSSFMVEVKN